MSLILTDALCLFCGHPKLGVINPCEECIARSVGMDLSLVFSDHEYDFETLEAFDAVSVGTGQNNQDTFRICSIAYLIGALVNYCAVIFFFVVNNEAGIR